MGPHAYTSSEHKNLKTLDEAIAVMAEAQDRDDAILNAEFWESQIEVKTWYTNGDFAGTNYYGISRDIVSQLKSLTEGTPQWGYTSETRRRLLLSEREKYWDKVNGERSKKESEEAKIR